MPVCEELYAEEGHFCARQGQQIIYDERASLERRGRIDEQYEVAGKIPGELAALIGHLAVDLKVDTLVVGEEEDGLGAGVLVGDLRRTRSLGVLSFSLVGNVQVIALG